MNLQKGCRGWVEEGVVASSYLASTESGKVWRQPSSLLQKDQDTLGVTSQLGRTGEQRRLKVAKVQGNACTPTGTSGPCGGGDP